MNDGKLGSSISGSSFKIPSSAFLILCCILSRRTYKSQDTKVSKYDVLKQKLSLASNHFIQL